MLSQRRLIVSVLLAMFLAAGTGRAASTPPPAAPTNLTATAVSSTSVSLSWTDNSNDETGFLIRRAGNPSGKWTTLTTTPANTTSFGSAGLTTGKTYYY